MVKVKDGVRKRVLTVMANSSKLSDSVLLSFNPPLNTVRVKTFLTISLSILSIFLLVKIRNREE